MATSSVVLDIRANTAKALGEFKKFSSQLDNKFLISGLKLDVVRSALGQINREFQKAIGEQGLAAGASMRTIENQAALLSQTFKGLSQEASLEMSSKFSEAFSKIAMTAGGTADDIKKSLNATPWISTNLSDDLRNQLSKGMMEFQTQARRAGFAGDYATIIQQFLAGQVTARDLMESGDALKSTLGVELTKLAGPDLQPNSEARSRAVLQLQQQEGGISKKLREMVARADWGQWIIEDLNTRLFNPQQGLFGALREVTMSIGDKTNILMETRKLIESVFGKQGFFVNFFAQIGKIFGIEDPLKVIIIGIRWITRQFDRLTAFLQSPQVVGITDLAQKAIKGTVDFFTGIYNNVTGFFSSEDGQRITTTAENAFKAVFTLESTLGGIVGAIIGSIIPGVGTLAGAGIGGSIGAISKLLKENEGINSKVSTIVSSVTNFFDAIFDTINAGDWDPSRITENVRDLGKTIRQFIADAGKSLRESDMDKQGKFFLDIFTTVIEEVAKTLGEVLKQLILTIFSPKGLAVAGGVIKTLNSATTGFFKGLFGNEVLGAIAGGLVTAGVGLFFARRLIIILGNVLGSINRGLGNVFFGGRGGGGGPLGVVNRILGGGPGGPRGRPPRSGPGGRGRRRTFTGGLGRTRLGRRARRLGRNIQNAPGRFSRAVQRFRAAAPRNAAPGARRRMIGAGLRAVGRGARALGRVALGTRPGRLITGGLAIGGLLLGGASAGYSKETPAPGTPEYAEAAAEKQQGKRDTTRSILSLGAGVAAGAAIGSIVPGLGTGIGAVIGGLIGGFVGDKAVEALSDSVVDGVIDFGEGIGEFFSKAKRDFDSSVSGVGSWASSLKKSVDDNIANSLKVLSSLDLGAMISEAITSKFNELKQGASGLATSVSNTATSLFNQAVEKFKQAADTISGAFEGLKSWLSGLNPFRNNFAGSNYAGPNLASAFRRERNNSGGIPFVANNTEFVIPTNGFSTLANMVEGRIANNFRSSSRREVSANFNVTININGNMGAEGLAQLEEQVMKVLDTAWANVTAGTVDRGTSVV